MKNHRAILPDGIVALIVSLLVTGPWFVRHGYLFFLDTVWGTQIPLDWHDPFFFINMLLRGLMFFFPSSFVQKLFITAILFIIMMASQALVRETVNTAGFAFSPWIQRGVALSAITNLFVFERLIYGQWGVILAYGLFLGSCSMIMRYVREQTRKILVLASVLFAFAAYASVHAAYFLWFPVGMLVVLRYGTWKRNLFDAAVFVGIALGSNLVWMHGLFYGNSSLLFVVRHGIQMQDFVASVVNGDTWVVRLFHLLTVSGFWLERSSFAPTIHGYQYAAAALFGAMGFFGVGVLASRNRLRRFAIYLFSAFWIAIFLAGGIGLPGGMWTVERLIQTVPGYIGFRDPSKWLIVSQTVLLMGNAIGIGYASALFARRYRWLVGIAVCFTFFATPFVFVRFAQTSAPLQYPSDWYAVDDYIQTHDHCRHETVVVPWHAYLALPMAPLYIVANPTDLFFHCSILRGHDPEFNGIYSGREEEPLRIVKQWLLDKGKFRLHDRMPQIRYIMLVKSGDWWTYDWIRDLPYVQVVFEGPTIRLYEYRK